MGAGDRDRELSNVGHGMGRRVAKARKHRCGPGVRFSSFVVINTFL